MLERPLDVWFLRVLCDQYIKPDPGLSWSVLLKCTQDSEILNVLVPVINTSIESQGELCLSRDFRSGVGGDTTAFRTRFVAADEPVYCRNTYDCPGKIHLATCA